MAVVSSRWLPAMARCATTAEMFELMTLMGSSCPMSGICHSLIRHQLLELEAIFQKK
jgi:hypothetical protein